MSAEITLKDIIETIIKSRRMLAAFFVIAVVLASFFYFTTPKSYTAKATILPIAGGSGGGIADFLAGTGLGMLTHSETKANVLLVALQSQTLAENVLKKHSLAGLILGLPSDQVTSADIKKAAKQLSGGIMGFSVSKNGLIVISATLGDQDKVAELATHYLAELSLFLNRKAINMNFTVIDEAQKPLAPSGPRLMKNMIISLGIAFFFCLMFISFKLIYFNK